MSWMEPLLSSAIAVKPDGLFSAKPMTPFSLEILRNRPIDADSGRNRADFESWESSFRIKKKISDGSDDGIWRSTKEIFAEKSARYDPPSRSSGSEGDR